MSKTQDQRTTATSGLIAPLLGPASLGVYAVAVSANVLPAQLGSAIALRTIGDVVRTQGAAAALVAERRLRQAVTCCSLAAVGSAVLIVTLLVRAFGPSFSGAIVLALTLLPGAALLGIGLVAEQVSVALGRPGRTSGTQAFGLSLTLLALPPALAVAGIEGAAFVSSVAYTARTAALLVLLRQLDVRAIAPSLADLRHPLRQE